MSCNYFSEAAQKGMTGGIELGYKLKSGEIGQIGEINTMGQHHGTTVHPKHEATTARMRVMFVDLRGDAGAEQRAREIASLPVKEWRGKPVYQIRCCGDYGKGPHDVWLPPYLLWSLLSLERYRCPYHQ